MNLHSRMKQYEAVSQTYLMRRTPVIIRLDGVAFHTFTKNFDKPLDEPFAEAMRWVTRYLVNNIQGCLMGYTQSDEISLVLQDYKKLDTDAWFGYNVQKIVSVSAKMATGYFNRIFEREILCGYDAKKCMSVYWPAMRDNEDVGFDSRCFNLPFEEVNNYFIDRQQDAERNSINLLAQQYYTQKELDGIKSKKLQDKLFTEQGVNWNDLPAWQKRGCVIIPKSDPAFDGAVIKETPIFSKNPDFVNSRVYMKEQ